MNLLRSSALAAMTALCLSGSAQAQADATGQSPVPALVVADASTAASAPARAASPVTFAIIEWRIKKGHEKDFLDYWATTSTIPDRTGLIGEFLSTEQDAHGKFPWINWPTRSTGEYTVFYNIGIWRTEDDYVAQIGKYADNSKAPMPFEYDHRSRVLVQPVEWRRGPVALTSQDAPGVK